MKQEQIPVVFRKWKDGDVIALFPSLNHESGDCNYGYIMSYMQIGQHSEACPTLVYETKLATEEEYAPLLTELKRIGYKGLVVKKKLNYHANLQRKRERIKALKLKKANEN